MEIDLREIQALHARYAREPVVIDLESLVRARPAPLLLAHDPNIKSATASPWRRAWDARGNVGRGALMVVGGTVLSAAIGMGAAAAWSKIHEHRAASVSTPPVQAITAAAVGQTATTDDVADGAPASAVRPLTSQDLGAPSTRAAALSSVDPAALLRSATPAAAANTNQADAGRAAASSDEQRAIASPLRQHILGRASQNGPTPVAPMHIPPAGTTEPAQVPAAPAKAVEQSTQAPPAPAAPTSVTQAASPERTQAPAPVHRVARHRAPAPQQTGSSTDVKSAPAAPSAPQHGGDVQLF
jgi:hypothetical protein